jgi:hypothetical protein
MPQGESAGATQLIAPRLGLAALQDAAARPADDASPATASAGQADLQDLGATGQGTFDSQPGAPPADGSEARLRIGQLIHKGEHDESSQ